ncbi:peptide ABC transporter permease [Bermanella sp. 47_1433_sub80_T6]|nr:peptide ABC transporter permease [Bermanella sp. 47_1433_sub80_T6]
MILPVFLWSDLLIYTLIASVGLFLWQLRKNPQAKKRWSGVFASKVGMASFIVILFYILISLLDSLHYREPLPQLNGVEQQEVAYSSEVKSVLDIVLSPLHSSNESTYSAPFSLHSFAKENMTDTNGAIYRDFPRLKNAGSHLTDVRERSWDILWRSVLAILLGILIAAVPIAAHKYYRNKIAQGTADHSGSDAVPWNVAYSTVLIISVIGCWVLSLSEFYHILGTDKVGSDVLYQSIKAIRTGVLIGTLATLVTLPLAIILGISAGYFKGWVDDVVQYTYTTLSSIPGILLIAASVLLIDVYIETHAEQFNLTTLRSDFKFLALCAILGLTSWTGLCRMLRAETLKVSQLDYVQAAHAFGVSHRRVIGKHILPNVTHLILIAIVLDFSMFVLAEAVLSYIGVGVDPDMHSWGNMINAARSELSRDPVVWWSVSAAFILMFTLVLAANLFSDEVRNAFDPNTAKGDS